MLEIFDKIKAEFDKLQNSINDVLSLKDFFTPIKKIYNLLEVFFSIVPFELILLIIFCALFLILINNISPSTPRINITIAVIIFSGIWIFLNKTFSGEYNFGRVFYTASFILIPAYFFEISRFGIKLAQKNRKINSPESLVPKIKEINLQYYEFLNAGIEFQKNPTAFLSSVKKLKNSLSDLENKI